MLDFFLYLIYNIFGEKIWKEIEKIEKRCQIKRYLQIDWKQLP